MPEGVWAEKWGENPFHTSPEFLSFIRENHPTNLYCTGRLGLDDYQNVISSSRRSYNQDWTHATLGPTGITPDAKMVRYNGGVKPHPERLP